MHRVDIAARLEGSVTFQDSDPILTSRNAIALLLALVVGICAGVLSYLASASVPAALLSGGNAAGSSFALFRNLVERYGSSHHSKARAAEGPRVQLPPAGEDASETSR